MSASLSNEDRCAVDLLLENTQPTAGVSQCFTQDTSATMRQRITRVENLLKLLDNHIAPVPPPDLVAQTLARCDRTAVNVIPPPPSQPTATA